MLFCNLTEQQRFQYLDEASSILCHDIRGKESDIVNDNDVEINHKKLKIHNFEDCSHLIIKNRKKQDVKGVLPNIMKLRQICNFAEFTNFGMNGNGQTDYSNRERALQFIEHSTKLKVRNSRNYLSPEFFLTFSLPVFELSSTILILLFFAFFSFFQSFRFFDSSIVIISTPLISFSFLIASFLTHFFISGFG